MKADADRVHNFKRLSHRQHTGTHAGRLLGRLVQHAICVNAALSAHGGDCNGRTRCGDPSHGCATERGSYCSYGSPDGRAEWREWCKPRPVLRKLQLHVGAGHQSPDVVAHGQATESASRRSESCGLGMFLLDSGEVGGLISTPVHQYDVARGGELACKANCASRTVRPHLRPPRLCVPLPLPLFSSSPLASRSASSEGAS